MYTIKYDCDIKYAFTAFVQKGWYYENSLKGQICDFSDLQIIKMAAKSVKTIKFYERLTNYH